MKVTSKGIVISNEELGTWVDWFKAGLLKANVTEENAGLSAKIVQQFLMSAKQYEFVLKAKRPRLYLANGRIQ